MTLVFCQVLADLSFNTMVIKDIDYVTIGKKNLSYRLKGKAQFIHTLSYDSVRRIRLYQDGEYEKQHSDFRQS